MSAGVLDAIDMARRDLQIAAEYKGMTSAIESVGALRSARATVAEYEAALDRAAKLADQWANDKGPESGVIASITRKHGQELQAALARAAGGNS